MSDFSIIKTEERIAPKSLWITTTPTPVALSLPFYLMEAGHFWAQHDYAVKRENHNSFLLLYTVKGQGTLISENQSLSLPQGSCAIIDCRKPHEYFSGSEEWEFLWVHFQGSSTSAMLELLHPSGLQATSVKDTLAFEQTMLELLCQAKATDIISCVTLSSGIHTILNLLVQSVLETEQANRREEHAGDIKAVVDFIHHNYASSITIDDMIRAIPISKYYFIRRFRRIMGVTPYNYLTNYRINRSKILLRTTDKSVSEIAEDCGFLDTSNFIAQFKKHTGDKPTHYRRDFSGPL